MKTDNELIAEFMGGRRQASSIMKGGVFYIFDQYPNQVFDLSDDRGLGYHKSWDWLMPVVEKINQVKPKHDFFAHLDLKNLTIDSLYKAVVEFIKWYNANK